MPLPIRVNEIKCKDDPARFVICSETSYSGDTNWLDEHVIRRTEEMTSGLLGELILVKERVMVVEAILRCQKFSLISVLTVAR